MWASKFAALVALLPGSLVLPGQADSFVPFTFIFDEQGNGSISINGGPFTALPGVLAPDPSNGGALALTYFLPTAAPFSGTGTILSYEDSSLTSLSDAFRITDATGNITGLGSADRVIFYSDVEPGDTDLADTGFPTNIMSGATVAEVEHILPSGDIGFAFAVPAPPPPPHNCPDCDLLIAVSERVVPEPASCLLLLTVLGLVGGPRLRRHIRRARSPEPVQAGEALTVSQFSQE
jgi:hypothetical protein